MIRIFSQYVSAKALLTALSESMAIVLCLVASAKLRFWNDPSSFAYWTMWPDFFIQAAVAAAIFQICFYYNDLYDRRTIRSFSDEFIRLAQSLGAGSLLLGFLYFALPRLGIGRGIFLIALPLVIGTVMLARVTLARGWVVTAPPQRVLVIGAGPLASTVARHIRLRQDDLNLLLVGFVSTDDTPPLANPVLGGIAELQNMVESNEVSRIIVALDNYRGVLPIRELVKLRVSGVWVEAAESALAALTGRVWLRMVRPSWFVFSDGFRRSRTVLAVKRLVDVLCAAFGLIVAAPILIAVAVAIVLDSGRPVFYRQVRVGYSGRLFHVLKFRSMRTDAEAAAKPQWAVENDPRVTRVGRFIRKCRLDELPQLFNILRGEMSMIGPRPERPEFVEILRAQIPYYDERHSMRPGLTGWAQVQYRYGSTVEDAYNKLEYDLFYLKNVSFSFDCAILFQTVRTVLFGQGAV